jgi:hypothetical protein
MDDLENLESLGSPLWKRGERGDFSTLDVCTTGMNPPQSPFSKGGSNPPPAPTSTSTGNANRAFNLCFVFVPGYGFLQISP